MPAETRKRESTVAPGANLSDLIARSATICSDGITWSRAELLRAIEEWGTFLDQHTSQVVALELDNGAEWVALSIALLDSGRAAVPIPSFFSAEQRAHALADSGVQLIVTCAREVTGAQNFRGTSVQTRDAINAHQLPPGTALITYTSGSTGAPKGACLSAASILDTAYSLVSCLGELGITRHLCVLPLTLLLEQVAGLYANLINGSRIDIPNLADIGIRGSSDIDVPVFANAIAERAPESLILVPQLLLGLIVVAEFGLVHFSSLKFVAVGGGKVTTDLLARAEACKLPVYEGYGLTECVSVVALNTPADRRPGTVGKLLPHVKAHVCDGELIVTEPRMLGYLGDESTRVEVIKTGDLVAMDNEGYVTVQGRKRNVFITAFGRNVSPEWLEAELQCEIEIALSLVTGEASPTNTALIIPRGDANAASIQAAIERCNARLPDYARISSWLAVPLAELVEAGGVTGNGRIRRTAALGLLNQRLAAGAKTSHLQPTGDPA